MESSKTATNFNLLGIDFQESFTRFFLIDFQNFSLKVWGPVKILTKVFENVKADSYFMQCLSELERISDHKISSRGLIIFPSTKEKGINNISIIGQEKFGEKISFLKAFEMCREEESFKLLLDYFKGGDTDVNLFAFDWPNLHFGFIEDQVINFKSINQGLNGFMTNFFAGLNDLSKILRWLPFDYEIVEVENYIANKALFPQAIPLTLRDLIIEQAILREMINQNKISGFPGGKEIKKIIVSGSLEDAFSVSEQILLTMIDSLSISGINYLYFDKKGLLKFVAPFLQKFNSEAKKKLITSLLPHKFTVLKLLGPNNKGKKVGKILISPKGYDKEIEVILENGKLYQIPLKGEVKIVFNLFPGVILYPSQKEESEKARESFKFEVQIESGEKGLIFDLRGDLSQLEKNPKVVASWYQALDIYETIQKLGDN